MTTTLRTLMGLTPPRQSTTRWPPFRVAALGVGYVPEGRRIFPNLRVHENLKVPRERPGRWDLERVYRHFPRLADRRANRGNQLSGCEQEMLARGLDLRILGGSPSGEEGTTRRGRCDYACDRPVRGDELSRRFLEHLLGR